MVASEALMTKQNKETQMICSLTETLINAIFTINVMNCVNKQVSTCIFKNSVYISCTHAAAMEISGIRFSWSRLNAHLQSTMLQMWRPGNCVKWCSWWIAVVYKRWSGNLEAVLTKYLSKKYDSNCLLGVLRQSFVHLDFPISWS